MTVFKSVVTNVGNVPTPEAFTLVTLTLGFPVSPCAFTASVAVFASVAVVAVPVTSPTTSPVRLPEKAPENVVAVMMPDALILPDVLIPTPIPLFGSPPTWKGLAGLVVPTPTLPSLYIDVTPALTLTSTHCDVGMLDNDEPSPLNVVAVITPLVASRIILLPTLT